MSSRSVDMACWKCGQALRNLLLPFSRYEECSLCKADLHCCRACSHYDSSASDGCREDRADFILAKERANFCDYFKVNRNAYNPADQQEAAQARAKLAALFGEEPEQQSPSSRARSPQSESERALAELKRLFGESDSERDDSGDSTGSD